MPTAATVTGTEPLAMTPPDTPVSPSEPTGPALTVVPLDALKTLLSEAQAVCQSPSRPSADDVARLRRAGADFDAACRQLGYAGSGFSGSFLPDISAVLRRATAHSCAPGTYDCNPYTLGMANGLLMAEALVAGREPATLSTPAHWRDDRFTPGIAGAKPPVAPSITAGEERLTAHARSGDADVSLEEDHY